MAVCWKHIYDVDNITQIGDCKIQNIFLAVQMVYGQFLLNMIHVRLIQVFPYNWLMGWRRGTTGEGGV